MGTRMTQGDVYLETNELRLGIHDTARNATNDNYWLARPLGDGRTEVILMNFQDELTNIREIVSDQELTDRFTHQPDYWSTRISPSERLLNEILTLAERHFEDEEYNSAEYEYNRALAIDEDSIRANFGQAMTYAGQGEVEKAEELFSKLATLEDSFLPEHKHLFNSFAIKLRRRGFVHQALEHYYRALTLIPGDDEHLWFNLGRAAYEDGQLSAAKKLMEKALAVNPGFLEADRFMAHYLEPPEVDLALDMG